MPGVPFVIRSGYRLLFWVGALTLAADQLSKWFIMTRIPQIWTVTVIPGFLNLVNVRNRGAAFGFLNRSDIDWQIWLFLGATVLAVGVILALARTPQGGRLLRIALGLVLGGALGNMVDRLRFRAVVDFVDVHVGAWHWPAFNVADSAICCGALLACLLLWRAPSAPRPAAKRKKA